MSARALNAGLSDFAESVWCLLSLSLVRSFALAFALRSPRVVSGLAKSVRVGVSVESLELAQRSTCWAFFRFSVFSSFVSSFFRFSFLSSFVSFLACLSSCLSSFVLFFLCFFLFFVSFFSFLSFLFFLFVPGFVAFFFFFRRFLLFPRVLRPFRLRLALPVCRLAACWCDLIACGLCACVCAFVVCPHAHTRAVCCGVSAQ